MPHGNEGVGPITIDCKINDELKQPVSQDRYFNNYIYNRYICIYI